MHTKMHSVSLCLCVCVWMGEIFKIIPIYSVKRKLWSVTILFDQSPAILFSKVLNKMKNMQCFTFFHIQTHIHTHTHPYEKWVNS